MDRQISNESLIYLRRSYSRNELSLAAQLEWAIAEAGRRKLPIDASQADLAYMVQDRISSYKSLRIDDGISGADMGRPGFQAVLRDIRSNPKILQVFSYRRDRLARPEDALQMATIECDIRKNGVTFVFNNGDSGPMDASNPDLGELMKLVVEYHQNGEDLRKLAERVLDTQRLLARDGYSTGGNAPFGFVRVLVDATGTEVMELVPGRRVRQQGCHVRWRAKDRDKIAVWILILDLKHKGLGGKRIAQRLNGLGIPSPGAGRTRTDHGVPHHVSGKWCQGSVLELCRNSAILGIKEYGNRSEGTHRRLGVDGHRTLTSTDRNQNNRAKVIRNESSLVVRIPTGSEPLYDVDKWNEIQQTTDERGKNQRGVPRSSDPAKYPLSCRVLDLADCCGSIMYGHQSGKRRLYTCGRYMRTSGSECHNNSVDAEALLRLTLLTLKQQINQYGQLNQIRHLLEERAKAEESNHSTNPRDSEIRGLTQRITQLTAEHQAIGRRMSSEVDDERYRFMASEFDRVTKELRNAELQLVKLQDVVVPAATASEKVEAAMELLSKIILVATDPNARVELRPLLEQLRLWIGLDFASAIKGQKRIVRRLVGGIIAFGGENLPTLLHGAERVTSGINADDKSMSSKAGLREPKCRLNEQKQIGTNYQHAGRTKSLAVCPPNVIDHQESVSSTKVSRGDWI